MPTDAAAAARLILDTLPLLNRTVATIVQGDAAEGLSMPQYRVLAHLSAGPLTVSELARRRQVTLAAMGELAQAMVERGLVERSPDPHDRRQQRLSPSAAGARRYAAAHGLAQEQIAATLAARLSPAEIDAVCAALSALLM